MVPKLRFSFKSALLPYKLGTLTQWSSGGTPSKDNKSYWDGDISWFTAASMKSNELSVSPTKISNSGLVNGSRLANKDDILLLVRGSMLFNKIPVGILLNDAGFNQDVKAIKSLKSFNHTFALQWFLAKEPLLLSMVTGTGIGAGKLDTKELQSLDVYLPGDEEQTKIADFLSSIDEKITLLSKQYELLCQYKKGMMQKIFSQQLRFKDDNGESFPQWEKNALSDLGNTYNGLTGKKAEDFGSGNFYVTYKQIFDSRIINPGNFGLVNILKDEKQNKVEYGDLFFTTSSETPDEVAFCSLFLETESVDYYLNSFCFGYRVKNIMKTSPVFLSLLFRSNYFRASVKVLAQGSTRYNISKNQFVKLIVTIPVMEEQIKISNFLTAIDDKITAKKVQLDKLKIWKQGLLQQMFV